MEKKTHVSFEGLFDLYQEQDLSAILSAIVCKIVCTSFKFTQKTAKSSNSPQNVKHKMNARIERKSMV
ncbi:MAG: hypothetical protein IJU47_04800 [Verrucomicrobia bacterium]|nr:hypothetical protein [Verrucomicrobiota bacterium]